MKWSITAEQLVQLKRDLIPSWGKSHFAAIAHVTQKQIDSEFKEDNQRKDLRVLRKPNKKLDMSFSIYATAADLKKDLQIKSKLWYEETFDSPMSDDAKHRYEIFCGGWLHYYDMEVRDGETEHVISFDWSAKSVKVYITPSYRPRGMNVYLHINPPSAGDPPKPKSPPPY